ncbi:MAG: SRPBCC family protein [Chthoniobacterales bacterium]
MHCFSRAVAVNPPSASFKLTRRQLWLGLIRKAENPVGFVPGMESSEIVERVKDGLIREAVYQGSKIRERVTIFEDHAIDFQQIETSNVGSVANFVSGDDDQLVLTFTFALRFPGVPEESPEEQRQGKDAEEAFLPAVAHTVSAIREMAVRGELGEAAKT